MRRITMVLLALLASAAPAQGKELAALEACGASACKTIEAPLPPDLLESERGAIAAPPAGAPRYTLRAAVEDPDSGVIREHFRVLYVPSMGALRFEDGRWYRAAPAGARVLRGLVAGLAPLRPAPRPAPGPSADPPVLSLLIAGGAVAALASGAALLLRRRRRAVAAPV